MSDNDSRIYFDPPHLNIPEITEQRAFYFEEDPDVWYVECEMSKAYEGYCPECGCMNIISHGKGTVRRIHDISIGPKSVDILLQTLRYKCKDCGATFRYPLKFVDEGVWITKRLKEHIRKKALAQLFKHVASEFGITIPTVSAIVEEYGGELDARRTLVAPRVLGIDENHIGHIMRGIFTDIERGTLLEMTENNKIPTMQAAIESMEGYDKILIVCMDMTRAYKSMVQLCCPHAVILVDKFHVVRYIYKATEKARKQIFAALKEQVDTLPDGEDKDEKQALLVRLGKDSYLFKFSTKRLVSDKSRISLMARLCSTFPELNELRILKMRAEKIYNESKDHFEAAANINDFILNIPDGSEYDDFRSFAKTLKNWMPEVLNYFKYGKAYTNAATEGVNALVKELNGAGRGYSFSNLRTKALYWSEGHTRPKLKARRKPEPISFGYMSGSFDKMSYMDMNDYFDDEYEHGDMEYIGSLLRHFKEIF